MHAPAETVPDISEILLQKNHLSLDHQISDMETPRPVTSGSAEFPRSSTGKLSLPSFLYGNPWFRVTPSFFRLCPFSLDAPKHQDRRKAATLRNGETPRLCPSETLNTTVFARFRSQIVSWRPPAPIVPNGGCAQSQSFPLPKLSRAVLIVRCAAGPLRASPASASLLRDLLTAVTPSKRFPTFAFVILFARSSLQ